MSAAAHLNFCHETERPDSCFFFFTASLCHSFQTPLWVPTGRRPDRQTDRLTRSDVRGTPSPHTRLPRLLQPCLFASVAIADPPQSTSELSDAVSVSCLDDQNIRL